MRRRRAIASIAVAVAAVAINAPASPAATPTVTDFPHGMPGGGIQWGITPASDGRIWFTSFGAHDALGSIDPLNPTSPVNVISTAGIGGSEPWWVTPGREGRVYFTTDEGNSVGAVEPTTGALNDVSYGAGNPAHPFAAVTGPDGKIWATEFRDDSTVGTSSPDRVGIIEPGLPPTIPGGGGLLTGNANPFGIAVGRSAAGGDGSPVLWATEHLGNRIARVSPATDGGGNTTGIVKEYALPAGSEPWTIALGPDGNMWFTELGTDSIGRFSPPTFLNGPIDVTRFDLEPGEDDEPRSIVAGPDGNMWIASAEVGDSKIFRMNMSGAVTGQWTIPNGRPNNIVPGADGNLWFTTWEGNRVGRITTALDPPEFRNTSQISIPHGGGAQNPPSTVNVTGAPGIITDVNVRLTGLSHTFPDDLDIVLEPPNNLPIMLASDVGSAVGSRTAGTKWSYPANGITLTFDDSAPFVLDDTNPLLSGIFRPTDRDNEPTDNDNLAPTPAGCCAAFLNTQQGFGANGAWKLWVVDDGSTGIDVDPPNRNGRVFGGWGLDIETEVQINAAKAGSGTGTITSAPAGINCAGDGGGCNALFSSDANVVLTATPAAGSRHSQWSGCDAVNGNQCTVDMDAQNVEERNVTAGFDLNPTPAGPTGQRAAALAKCKKTKKRKAKRKCRRKANLLPL